MKLLIITGLECMDIDRFIALQGLPFRGRSGSLLGVSLVGSPLNRISRRSLAPSVPFHYA
ncbi:hypothetical protein [Peribacillus muralis]|uniref:hypothetical protein n=1 Tax=Peribacillus muralis TaxID=264697 RepID=UPI003671D2CB